MADPLSVITGITGLITLGLEVTKIAREYVLGVRNAAKDVEEFLQEIFAPVHVLCQLVDFLKSVRIGTINFDQTSVLLLRFLGNPLEAIRRHMIVLDW